MKIGMKIGIPKERKTLENRVALTPAGAAELIRRKHKVVIEKNAGAGAHFSDSEYKAVGCTIAETLEQVWGEAELLVKVKEPHEDEYQYFREGLAIFDYLHLAGLPEVAKELSKKKVTGFAYELVTLDNRRFPLLEPMSEIAGKLSILNGGNHLLTHNGGRGILLGGAVGVLPAHVIVIGAGIAGRAACQAAIGLGARVTLLDISQPQLDFAKNIFQDRIATAYSNNQMLEDLAPSADLVIGAVLVPGAKAPRVVNQDIKNKLPKGSVIVDISIDQGGCVENIKTTSLKEPTYLENGVIHYAVPNMPAQVARTSTLALTSATLPYIINLADNGIDAAVDLDRKNSSDQMIALRNSCCSYRGEIVNEIVRESLKEL